MKSTEKFSFSEPILETTELFLIRSSVYNSVFSVNRGYNQFLYDGNTLAVISGAYELTQIAELIKEETNGIFIMESDKNTMKILMELKQGSLNFDIENSIASLKRLRKIANEQGKFASQKISDIVGLVLLKFTVMLYLVLKIMVITQTYYTFLL